MSRLILPAALLLALALPGQVLGQDWDDVSWPVLSARHLPEAPGAAAVVLFDRGTLTIDQLFRHRLERHCRVKILTDDAAELAEVRIPYRRNETIRRFKAQTILPNRERVKVDKRAIHDETAGLWQVRRFTFPDVQAGAVVEFTYEIRSEDLGRISPWVFQNDALTKESEFKVRLPVGMTFDAFFNAHQIVTPRPVKDQVLDPEVLGATLQQVTWTMNDVPPLAPEPLMPSLRDHRTALYFQILAFRSGETRQKPGSGKSWEESDKSQREFRKPWEEIGSGLLAACEDLLRNDGGVSPLATRAVAAGASPEKTARALYRVVRDEVRTIASPAMIGFGATPPGDVAKAGQGNGLEKNLLLACLLRKQGIVADPMLISTRPHGSFSERYRNDEQFDHAILRVTLGNAVYFLDASDPFCPFGVLPPDDLVSAGLLLASTGPRILELDDPTVESLRECRTNATLQGNGDLQCSTRLTLTGYHGISGRRDLAESGELAYVRSLLESRFGEIVLDSTGVEGQAKEDSALVLTATYRIPEYARISGGLIRLATPVVGCLAANPFVSESRTYPIEYSFPSQSEELVKLTVPKGVRFVEVPPDQRSRLGAISVDRKCKVKDSTLYFRRRFVMEGITVPETEYPEWRNLYAETMSTKEVDVVLRGNLIASG